MIEESKITRRSMHSKARKRARHLRRQIVAALGTACECCGETIPHALTIDHRQNDGAAHRRQFPDVRDLYRAIIAEGCPRDRYAILCQNCHNSKNERGECAHVAEARAIFMLVAEGQGINLAPLSLESRTCL